MSKFKLMKVVTSLYNDVELRHITARVTNFTNLVSPAPRPSILPESVRLGYFLLGQAKLLIKMHTRSPTSHLYFLLHPCTYSTLYISTMFLPPPPTGDGGFSLQGAQAVPYHPSLRTELAGLPPTWIRCLKPGFYPEQLSAHLAHARPEAFSICPTKTGSSGTDSIFSTEPSMERTETVPSCILLASTQLTII